MLGALSFVGVFLSTYLTLYKLGAIMDGELFGPTQIEALSKYPTKTEAQGQVIQIILGAAGQVISAITRKCNCHMLFGLLAQYIQSQCRSICKGLIYIVQYFQNTIEKCLVTYHDLVMFCIEFFGNKISVVGLIKKRLVLKPN